MQVWNVNHVILTEINVCTGQDKTALQVLCSVCSHSHTLRVSCINSSADFSLGTCS